MSDNLLKLIPTQPEYVPDRDAQFAAQELLGRIVENGRKVLAYTTEQVEFVDAGANFEGLSCPVCGQSISGEWWSAAISKANESAFTNLNVVTPCCETSTSLNDLNYNWAQGFARFVLQVRNPGVASLDKSVLSELETILGCKLRVVWAHL
jgi:hypothetical protein